MVTPRYEPRLPKLEIELPYSIGGLEFAFVEDYSHDRELATEGAGLSLRFQSESEFTHADVFEYDWNRRDLVDGILSRPVLDEFFQMHAELHDGINSGYYTTLSYLEQRLVVAPGSAPPRPDEPLPDPPAEPADPQAIEWLAATYMGAMPRNDGKAEPPLRSGQQSTFETYPGDEPEDFSSSHDPDHDDEVVIYLALTVFGGQYLKLRYTHYDDDDPALEQGFHDFINEFSALLSQHRKG